MNCAIIILLAIFCSNYLVTAEESCREDGKIIVCYYASWAIYRIGAGKMNVSQIEPELCTHLVYTFAGLDILENRIVPLDPWNDLSSNGKKGAYDEFVQLKQKRPCLKTLLAIGGWNEMSRKYSLMAYSEESRKKFVSSLVRFLVQYDFDGIDFDWEYPTQRGGIAEDKNNFVQLLKEIKQQIKPWNLLLTVAVAVTENIVKEAYDIKAIEGIVDYVSLMAYDYTSPTSKTTGLIAPLRSKDENNIERSINLWINSGLPAEKLVLGIPMYGRFYKLKNAASCTSKETCGVGIETAPNDVAGRFTKELGFLANYEIAESLKLFKYDAVKLSSEQNYFAFNTTFWITYDAEDTIKEKVKYAIGRNLKGIMVWSIDTDDFRPMISKTKFPLLRAVNDALNSKN